MKPNVLARVKPYLPLAARVLTTAAAALAPIAAAVVAKEPISNETVAASFIAGSAAWKRWHPSASLATLWGPQADQPVALPATEAEPRQ